MVQKSKLSEFLISQSFVAFDTETTGIWAPAHRIVEIGAIKFHLASDTTDSFQQLINPERPMPEEVIKIHGLTDAMIADAPTISKVLPQFLEFCGDDSILIAHNARFDLSFVGCELERLGADAPSNLVLDTVDIFRRLYPEIGSYSLLALARNFDLATRQEHRALADAALVRCLFEIAAEKFTSISKAGDFTNLISTYNINDAMPRAVELPDQYAVYQDAVTGQSRMRILYRSDGSDPFSRIVHVKNIYQQGARYYLNAFCEHANAERTFRLDRIEEYEILNDL